MKKFTLYSFAALALMLGTASCGDDFLSVEPSSSLPIDGYYTTESRMMESAVAATIRCNGMTTLVDGHP